MRDPGDQLFLAVVVIVNILGVIIGLSAIVRGWIPIQLPRGFDLSEGAVKSASIGRKRRPILGGAGAALTLLCLLGIGFFGYISRQRADLYHFKPFWWLKLNLESADPTCVSRAFNEMNARLNHGELAAAQQQTLIGRGLDIQQQGSLRPTWGNWIDQTLTRGQLSAADTQRYFQAAHFVAALESTAFVSRGNLMMQIKIYPSLSNAGPTLMKRLTYDVDHLQLALGGVPLTSLRPIPMQSLSGGNPLIFEVDPTELFKRLSDGSYPLEVHGALRIHLPDQTDRVIPLNAPPTITLGPPPAISANSFVHDPAARDRIAAAFSLQLQAQANPGKLTSVIATLHIDSSHLPHDVAFNVVAIDEDLQPSFGKIFCRRGDAERTVTWTSYLDLTAGTPALNVMFLPDEAARLIGSTDPIWDGGITMHNLPVKWSTPATTQSAQ